MRVVFEDEMGVIVERVLGGICKCEMRRPREAGDTHQAPPSVCLRL